MRPFITFLGVILILISIYGLFKIYNEPLAVIETSEGIIEVLPPKPTPYSILGFERGVRLKLPNGTVVSIVGSGEVPLRIDTVEVRLLFDAKGRFLALTAENVSISRVEVSEEFSKAVLTYTVAPFIAGLAFTTASLMVKGGRRR